MCSTGEGPLAIQGRNSLTGLGKTKMAVLDFHTDFQLLDLCVAVSSLEASHGVQNSLGKMKVMPLLYCF